MCITQHEYMRHQRHKAWKRRERTTNELRDFFVVSVWIKTTYAWHTHAIQRMETINKQTKRSLNSFVSTQDINKPHLSVSFALIEFHSCLNWKLQSIWCVFCHRNVDSPHFLCVRDDWTNSPTPNGLHISGRLIKNKFYSEFTTFIQLKLFKDSVE